MELAIRKIIIGDRFRSDVGNLEALAASIDRLGLLQPIVVRIVQDNYVLVAGWRRLEACKQLGWKKVSVHVITHLVEAVECLIAERDENTCRKDFTPSEAVAIGKALEELEKPQAKKRQAEKLKKGNATPVVESCHNGESKGKTRDKVASAVGLSGRTYEKAKAVVAAAEQKPEQFGAVKEEMDRTGKVDRAYRKIREESKADEAEIPPNIRHEILDAFMELWGRMTEEEKAFICKMIR